jgi:hypothetical protein
MGQVDDVLLVQLMSMGFPEVRFFKGIFPLIV